MSDETRAARIERVRSHLRTMRESDSPEVYWKDALAYVEGIAPEGSIVPDIAAMLKRFRSYEQFFAVTLLGATRHWDAWPVLERLVLDPESNAGANAASELARVGGDAGYVRLLALAVERRDPLVRDRLVSALREYDRPEGAIAIRGLHLNGDLTALDAAVRVAHMKVPLEAIAAWSGEDSRARVFALEVLISRAAPTWRAEHPAALSPSMRAWILRTIEAPPRPLEGFERRRLQAWLDGD